MKKIMIILMTVIMTMVMIMGCGLGKESGKKSEVEVEEFVLKFDDMPWYVTEYIYKSEDMSEARRLCKANMNEHLENGETVSEMILSTDEYGNDICYFRVYHIIEGN